MVKWFLTASLLVASAAHANELASDGRTTPTIVVVTPPPPPPRVVDEPPRMRSLGFRFGMANTQLDEHDRTLMTFGVQAAIEIIERRMRGVLDYEWLMVFGTDNAMKSTRGRGHGLRVGARLTLAHMMVRDVARLYVDAESAIGAAYVSDSEVGTTVLPNVIVGARIGYELYPQGSTSESKLFDAHLMFRALVTRGDVGFVFGVGMEWGR